MIEAVTTEIQPIIVVGMNRTGTKWVSNSICAHNDVAGVLSDRSRGILETNMFGIMQSKFDLAYPEEYVALVELWAKTELFKHTGEDKACFYELSPRPRNPLALFQLLMERHASRQGKRFWLQKTSPREALTALAYFRNARVVVSRRNIVDTLKSTWAAQLRYRDRKLLRSVYVFVRQEKLLNRICREFNAIEIRFEDLKENPQREISDVLRRLDLDPAKWSYDLRFRKNTSFQDDDERSMIMTGRQRSIVLVLATILRLVPLRAMMILASLREVISGRRGQFIVAGSLGPLVDELADRSRDK